MAGTPLTINNTPASLTERPEGTSELARGRPRRRRRHILEGMAYALPGMAILALFRFWPMIFGTYISLFEWGFGQSFLVTLYYTVGTIPIAIAAAFLIAYSLFYHFRNTGRAALRTVFFLPQEWLFENYVRAWLKPESTFGRYFWNTIIVAGLGTVVQLAFCVAIYFLTSRSFNDAIASSGIKG